MGTNYDSPDNLQFNAGDIIFISFIFVEKFKFYGNTSNFTILGKNNFFYPSTSNFFTEIGVFILLNALNNNPSTKGF
jgi:hypothetical protein